MKIELAGRMSLAYSQFVCVCSAGAQDAVGDGDDGSGVV